MYVGRWAAVSLVLCAWWLASPRESFAAAVPIVEADGDSKAGHVTVSWQAPDEVGAPLFQVQEAQGADFQSAETIYEGTHTARVISGLRDGVSYYRARVKQPDGWSPWSEPARFEVAHPALHEALLLFGVGALLFGATAVTIVRGNRKAEDG